MHQSFVDEAHHAQQADACRAERQRQAYARRALERSHRRETVRREGLGNVHGLDHQQVVEKGDDGVHQRKKHDQIPPLGKGRRENEELGEETGKRGDAAQREQGQRQHQCQARVRTVKPAVGVAVGPAARMLLDGADNGKDGYVGRHVHGHIEHQRGHALRRACEHAQKDITGLRDAAEGHETLHVALQDGHQVGHGDAGHGKQGHGERPVFFHQREHLAQDDGQGHGGGSLGNDTEIGRHAGRRALVDVGRPQMERHEAHLEAHPGEEEHQGELLQRAALEHGRKVGKIERAGSAVDERQAVEQQGGREHRAQDKLGSGFRTVVAVFVEGHEAGHGDAGHFQSDVEYQEMPGGHHEEHAQQGGERQHVELALFIVRVFPSQPFAALEEDKQRAGRKDGLDDGRERGVDVHAAEECAGVGRKVQSYLECHQHANDRMKPTLAMAAHEKVGQEGHQQNQHQRQLGMQGQYSR